MVLATASIFVSFLIIDFDIDRIDGGERAAFTIDGRTLAQEHGRRDTNPVVARSAIDP